MTGLPKYDLLELPWTDVADWIKAGNDVVMIPIGSCEKHGNHVPLGVDSYTTMGSVERAAVKAKVVYAPLMPFGHSPHHMGEAGWGTGSISLPAEVYRQVLYALGRSLIFAGFNKLVYVTHHGTNMGPQGDVLRTLRAETGCFCAFYKTPTERECAVVADLLQGPPEETPGWHAGELETSTCMAYLKEKGLYEGSVLMERAKQDRAHAPKWMGPAFSKKDGTNTVIFRGSENIFVPMLHHEYSDIATIGNPLRSSVEQGFALFERISDHLAAFLEEVKTFDFQVPMEKRDWPGRFWRG
ncbi:MAG TPA: creatininase family protein [Candidatus Methylomirabilis sp.]|nr:creatininase family protein [Candidatus Methylomirabilis sp.]